MYIKRVEFLIIWIHCLFAADDDDDDEADDEDDDDDFEAREKRDTEG